MSTKPNRNYFNLSLKEGSAERKERGWKECERERGRQREREEEGRKRGSRELSVPADAEEAADRLNKTLRLNSPYSYLSINAAW